MELFKKRLRLRIIILICLSELLLVLTVFQYPPVLAQGGLLGLAAATLILLFYGYLALLSPLGIGKIGDQVLFKGAIFGVIGGFVLALDLICGYLFPSVTLSTKTSLVAYGVLLFLIFISGFTGTRLTGRIKSGIVAAVWCVLIALLIWFFFEFLTYLIFVHTPGGAVFIRDEMQSDFLRSGATDYQAFALNDYYGAGFYHLTLGLIISPILGSIGAIVSHLILWLP